VPVKKRDIEILIKQHGLIICFLLLIYLNYQIDTEPNKRVAYIFIKILL